jgi:hypothetical protein
MSNNRDLGGYDQVIQFSQRDINRQLFHLWDDEHLPDVIDEKAEGGRLTCEVAAPQIYLHARFPHQVDQRVYLEMFLGKGTFITPRRKLEIAETPWKVSIRAELCHDPITHQQVREHRRLPEEVRERILAHDEDRFGIWHLYVQLARGTVHDNLHRERSTFPPLEEDELRLLANLLEQHLKANIGQEHGLHLGFTPALKVEAAADPAADQDGTLETADGFRPTLVHHSITYEPQLEEASSVNYLMMTRGKAAPTGPGAGVVVAVGARGPESRMRLSQRFFIDETAIPRIAAHYPQQRLTRRQDVRDAWSSKVERQIETGRHAGPFRVDERTLFHLNVQTERREPHGHNARMYIGRVSRFEFTNDCPRDGTVVGELGSGDLFVRFTAAGDHLRPHAESKTSRGFLDCRYDTRKWLGLGCYTAIFREYVTENAVVAENQIREAQEALARGWEGIRTHVLPGARFFTFKDAGAELIHDYLNLTLTMTYTAAEGSAP